MNENKIYCEDCLDTMARMPDNYLDCVVTSPPYWGLRDYGLQPSIWDAQDGCLHEWGVESNKALTQQTCYETGRASGDSYAPGNKLIIGNKDISQGRFCIRCNAWRGNLGLEPTPELYVQHIVTIFQEIKRALKPEGTVWLNLGDSYATNRNDSDWLGGGKNAARGQCVSVKKGWHGGNDLKNKDLCGIPWRVAFALQANGWYLRSDIIWHKPNPMPESVTDRPTKSHEYIFLLTKSARYFYDADTIREGKAYSTITDKRENENGKRRDRNYTGANSMGGTNLGGSDGQRNKRSVWTVNTQPFPDAHFAVFPVALIVPCIKAGCPKGGIIYDPFFGSGTTGEVALRLDRKYIGSELNPDYVKIAERRLSQDKCSTPLFSSKNTEV